MVYLCLIRGSLVDSGLLLNHLWTLPTYHACTCPSLCIHVLRFDHRLKKASKIDSYPLGSNASNRPFHVPPTPSIKTTLKSTTLASTQTIVCISTSLGTFPMQLTVRSKVTECVFYTHQSVPMSRPHYPTLQPRRSSPR